MNGHTILKLSSPFSLFSKDLSLINKEYRDLVKEWHPDHNKDLIANDVFSKIGSLYNQAKEMLSKGTWVTPNEVKVIDKNGKSEYVIRYKKKHNFELGDMYISDTILAYKIDDKFAKFYNNFIDNVKCFHFANKKMEKEMSKYLPLIIKSFKSSDGYLWLIISKTKDLLLLDDVIDHYGKIDPKHVAWIISSLYNTLCYFKYLGIVHSGLSTKTCFISPEHHSVAILGGWWYSVPEESKMIGISSNNFKYIPNKCKDSKESSCKIDLELLRLLGRQSLGDTTGVSLRSLKNRPKPMINWLIYPNKGSAIDEYKEWYNSILTNSFGPHKFIKMNLTSDMLYN